jgi:hypothetical protein
MKPPIFLVAAVAVLAGCKRETSLTPTATNQTYAVRGVVQPIASSAFAARASLASSRMGASGIARQIVVRPFPDITARTHGDHVRFSFRQQYCAGRASPRRNAWKIFNVSAKVRKSGSMAGGRALFHHQLRTTGMTTASYLFWSRRRSSTTICPRSMERRIALSTVVTKDFLAGLLDGFRCAQLVTVQINLAGIGWHQVAHCGSIFLAQDL